MLNCCRNEDECNCECHGNDNIMHCAPCCYKCPFCEINIPTYVFDHHKEKCSSKKTIIFDKIGIVGSRTFNDYLFMKQILDRFFPCNKIISGGAKGADSLAAKYAKESNIELKEFLPDWNRYGKSAGFKRNKQIVDASDIIVAFWDGESRGTANTISLAHEQNKTVYRYWPKDNL
jgi:predicted Rossmann fold nucleotide-binding protein DprA/Smf involved in DNA uptake